MSTCRACRESENEDAAPSWTSAVLLVRVWPEGDQVRGRLLATTDPGSPAGPVAVAHGVEAIGDAVREWLRAL